MKRIITTIALIAAVCASFVSCQKEDNGIAPVPPSVESLQIAFDKVPLKSAMVKSDDIDPGFTRDISSLTDVIYRLWSHVYNEIANIPVHAFEAVVDVEPVNDGEGHWIWSSGFTAGSNKYTTDLIGTVKNKIVNWELRVSLDSFLGYRDYTWITGWSNLDGTEGSWDIRVSPIDTDVVVRSDWQAAGGQVQRVRLSYALDHNCGIIGAFFNGSYAEFSRSASDPTYDTSLTLRYNQSLLKMNVDASVEWNSSTGACRLLCKDIFSDTDWHVRIK